MLVLSGIAVVIAGFALRFNPLLVVTAAGIVTGLAAGWDLAATVAALGKGFVANRYMAVTWLILPVIGLSERGGLKERAHILVGRLRGISTGRLLILYLGLRQVSVALGLASLGGHVQMVRPLLAPMAEAAAEQEAPLDDDTRETVRAHAAAVENIGLVFGEDIFVALGGVLLIRGFLAQNGFEESPMRIAVWSIPTAIAAFAIHAARLWLLDRRLARRMAR